ncbi:PE family protein [Mycobacterium camsae]|uniref:PE family protein n=1 Tax=Mycobacterium gordonae TaxID=1778 RepID=UPI00198148F8|nr:PE family protein [Mycobacterium gordonae]
MSFLFTQPQLLASAATDLAGIGSTLSAANAAAALPTTSVMAAGADDVSAAMATIFGAHAQQYQAMGAQASKLHDQFVQAMNGASGAYADAESANAKPLQPVAPVTAPARAAVNYCSTRAATVSAGRPVGLLSASRASVGPVGPPNRGATGGSTRANALGPAGATTIAGRRATAGGPGVIAAAAKRPHRSFGAGGPGARGNATDLRAR